MAYGLRVRGVAKDRIAREVADALKLVHMGDLEDRYPSQLSGGQRQRVALARAVVIRLTILLFDEPLTYLDAKLRGEMRTSAPSATAFGDCYDLRYPRSEKALSMADRIVVMSDGRVEQIGTPEEIYDRPRTRFVAEFIGSCNFLQAQVVAVHRGHVRLKVGEMELAVVVDGTAPAPGFREQVLCHQRPRPAPSRQP